MNDESNPAVPAPGDEESVISLTDLIDNLEQRAFTRSLDLRHPGDDAETPITDAERA